MHLFKLFLEIDNTFYGEKRKLLADSVLLEFSTILLD